VAADAPAQGLVALEVEGQPFGPFVALDHDPAVEAGRGQAVAVVVQDRDSCQGVRGHLVADHYVAPEAALHLHSQDRRVFSHLGPGEVSAALAIARGRHEPAHVLVPREIHLGRALLRSEGGRRDDAFTLVRRPVDSNGDVILVR